MSRGNTVLGAGSLRANAQQAGLPAHLETDLGILPVKKQQRGKFPELGGGYRAVLRVLGRKFLIHFPHISLTTPRKMKIIL